MTKNVSKKTVSLLLAFVMVFSVLLMPNITEAKKSESKPAEISYLEKDSYIKADVSEIDGKDYVTITTFGGNNEYTGKKYGNVVRGNIFLTYPKDVKETDLKNATVKLKAQKEFEFTIKDKNGDTITVKPNDKEPTEVLLDLTKENVVTLDVSSNEKFEEGSYVISGGKKGETVEITTSISVKNPKLWLAGNYQGQYTIESPAQQLEMAQKVEDAIKGFDTLGKIKYTVPKGTSAMKVLKSYGNYFNMNIDGISSGYIRKMGVGTHEKIGEFDINKYSGWMYTINEGEGWYFPSVGADGKTFDKNAEMVWHFTMSYGSDIDASWGVPSEK